MSDEVSRRDVLRSELERIWDDRRRLTPADIVESATPPESPLHDRFEWDNSEAAHQYRLVQAAGLIRSVKIKITVERPSGEVEDIKVRSWLPLRAAGDETAPPGYMPEYEVRDDPERRKLVLQQMQREMQRLHRRHQHYAEYWSLMDQLMAERPSEAASG